MKKFLPLALCLLMLVGLLVGCGGNGTDGKDGITPVIGANGNWFIGDTDTGVKAVGEDGVGIKNVSAKLVTDPDTGAVYLEFTYKMSNEEVQTVKMPYSQNNFMVPQPVAAAKAEEEAPLAAFAPMVCENNESAALRQ